MSYRGVITLPLSSISSMVNTSYDDATIFERVKTNDGQVYVGTLATINEGQLFLQECDDSIYFQKWERTKQLAKMFSVNPKDIKLGKELSQ